VYDKAYYLSEFVSTFQSLLSLGIFIIKIVFRGRKWPIGDKNTQNANLVTEN
jgi:hypothetical protein